MAAPIDLNENSLKEFYQYVYPVDDVVQWLSYRFSSESESDELQAARGVAADGYLSRREFCFTLIGDIFTRFRSYSSASELRQELVNRFPEKIDVGAVYNIRPSQKQQAGAGMFLPMERELVFDIDMSDYDKIRSCCQGKSICRFCWTWMSCAAWVLRTILTEDFGFKYLLPIFSGRRGIHLWVCDKRARKLADDERAAIVGYMTVFLGEMKTNLTNDIVNSRPIHPSMAAIQSQVLAPAFEYLFLGNDETNPNSVLNPRSAGIVYEALTVAVRQCNKKDVRDKFNQIAAPSVEDGIGLDWGRIVKSLGDHAPGVLAAVQFMLMYPRLDEHVSTHRDHLLKLPFCIHPGTGRLCCPLRWEALHEFDPVEEAPTIQSLLMERHIEMHWKKPLLDMLSDMSLDADEL